jgi:hypothetical protein
MGLFQAISDFLDQIFGKGPAPKAQPAARPPSAGFAPADAPPPSERLTITRETAPGGPPPAPDFATLAAPAPEPKPEPSPPYAPAPPAVSPAPEPAPETEELRQEGYTIKEARRDLKRIRTKMAQLADAFASGAINRSQFEEMYAHYQKQRRYVELLSSGMADEDEARMVIAEGSTVMIKRRHEAKVLAYAIYSNETSLPLLTQGDFRMDTALVVGMLSGFSSATEEMFGAGLSKTEVEDGKVLCFVPGAHTTLITLYSTEPSPAQLDVLDGLHRDFEVANHANLTSGSMDPEQLVFPHAAVLGTPRPS